MSKLKTLFTDIIKCYTPKPRYISMLNKIYPTDGSDNPQNLGPLGVYGSGNPDKLRDIGSLIYENIQKDVESLNINRIIVGLKIFDSLVDSCPEIYFFSDFIVQSGRLIINRLKNLRVMVKLFETIKTSVKSNTLEQMSVFVEDIIRMIGFNSIKLPQEYVLKIRVLGMVSLLTLLKKMNNEFLDSLPRIMKNLLLNITMSKRVFLPEGSENDDDNDGDGEVLSKIDDYESIMDTKIIHGHLVIMAKECIKRIGLETNSNYIKTISIAIFNFLNDHTELWEEYHFLVDLFKTVVHLCRYGNTIINRLFLQITDKTIRVKVIVSRVVFYLLEFVYTNKSRRENKQRGVSIHEENDLVKNIIDFFLMNEREIELNEVLLKIVGLIAKFGINTVNHMEYIIKKKECKKSELLLFSLSMFGNSTQIKVQFGSFYPEGVLKRMLAFIGSPNVTLNSRLYLLGILSNIRSEDHSRITKKKRAKVRAVLSEMQLTDLQFYLFKLILLKDNSPRCFIEILSILFNHVRGGFKLQLPWILHLNGMSFDGKLKEERHKLLVDTFIASYFIVLSRVLKNKQFSNYISEITSKMIEVGQVTQIIFEEVENSFESGDKFVLKRVFYYCEAKEIRNFVNFDNKVLVNLLKRARPDLREHLDKPFSKIQKSSLIYNDSSRDDWKMFVPDGDEEEVETRLIDPQLLSRLGNDIPIFDTLDLNDLEICSEESVKFGVGFHNSVERILDKMPSDELEIDDVLDRTSKSKEISFSVYELFPKKSSYLKRVLSVE